MIARGPSTPCLCSDTVCRHPTHYIDIGGFATITISSVVDDLTAMASNVWRDWPDGQITIDVSRAAFIVPLDDATVAAMWAAYKAHRAFVARRLAADVEPLPPRPYVAPKPRVASFLARIIRRRT
jgi:hypothetical protein